MIQENSQKFSVHDNVKTLSVLKSNKFHVIIVTGTPATGKTTIAKKIAEKKNFEYVDVNVVIEKNKLESGYDEKRDSKIINTEKLNNLLIEKIKNSKNIVIDSHLSHYLPKEYVDLCIVTKCGLKELEKRLKQRGYSEEKIRENLDAEIFDTCKTEAQEQGHNVKVVWSDKEVEV
ncbi:AAA family ATPase [Candidatus Woesearchaeota archaeon]|nr:AAA family ATPase [Candidatus Woesearchaeota archaeon]